MNTIDLTSSIYKGKIGAILLSRLFIFQLCKREYNLSKAQTRLTDAGLYILFLKEITDNTILIIGSFDEFDSIEIGDKIPFYELEFDATKTGPNIIKYATKSLRNPNEVALEIDENTGFVFSQFMLQRKLGFTDHSIIHGLVERDGKALIVQGGLEREVVPCHVCGYHSFYSGTRLCDNCYNLRNGSDAIILQSPERAVEYFNAQLKRAHDAM
jgi:hypothetical protein